MLIFLMVSNMWNEIQLQREARCQQIIHFHQKGGKKGRAKVQKNRVQHSKQKTQYSALTQTRYHTQEHHYLKITYQFDLSIFTQVTTKIFTTSLLIPLLLTIQFHTHAFYSYVSTMSLPLVGKKCSLYGNSKFSYQGEVITVTPKAIALARVQIFHHSYKESHYFILTIRKCVFLVL